MTCSPIPIPDDIGNELPDSVVDTIGESADVVLRFGFGIIKGDVLNACEYGVLSFHHGDLREYRGGPPGFWEFQHGKAEAGVTLQVLNETLDGGQIAAFESVDISDAKTWGEVKQRLFRTSPTLLKDAVSDIRTDSFDPEKTEELGELYTRPGPSECFSYFKNILSSGGTP
jgi:methionyl-tRNA formyltransferase